MTEAHLAIDCSARQPKRPVDKQELPGRVSAILHSVARAHALTLWDLTGRSRAPVVVAARREAAHQLREMNWLGHRPPVAVIGKWLNRDHTTVVYMLQRRAKLNPPQSDAAWIFQTGQA